ncbi:MAG: hypothetical protein ABJ360_02415 [Roseobacter sp.]
MAVPHRSLEETMAGRGIDVGHATVIRWVEKYASIIAAQAHRWKTKPDDLGGYLLGPLLRNALLEERRRFRLAHRSLAISVSRDR